MPWSDRIAGSAIHAAAIGVLSFCASASALTLDPFTDTQGVFSLRVSHDPAAEPIAAFRLRLFLKAGAQPSSLELRPGPSEVWSQVPPALDRADRILDITAVSPNHTALALDSSLTVFRLDLALAGAVDTALIDSAQVVEAYDAGGHPLKPALRMAAFTVRIRAKTAPGDGISLRHVDRMHEIAFYLSKSMPVRARVLDARGKSVRTLQDGASMPAGRQRLRWDGRDASGRMVPSGEYFLELRLGPNTYVKTVRHAL